jgi:hypothetical protein
VEIATVAATAAVLQRKRIERINIEEIYPGESE